MAIFHSNPLFEIISYITLWYNLFKKGYIIISVNKTLQEQFSLFCNKNGISNMEQAVEYFAVFGGLEDVQINTNIPIEDLITEFILDDYKYLRNIVADVATSDPLLHAILSGIAMGDRRTNSSFKRANVSFKTGMECVEELVDLSVLSSESSLIHLSNQRNYPEIAKKLIFRTPFLRFWFAFISPIFKGIRDGNYEEFYAQFQNRKTEFFQGAFEQLCREFLKLQFTDENRLSLLGSYWDNNTTIDLVAKTNNGQIIAGSCKYTNAKLKKSVLNTLKEDTKKVQLPVDIFVLFSKSGFSSELKNSKSEELKLYTAKSLKALIS